MKTILSLLFSLVMLIAGLLFSGLSVKNTYNYFSTKDWQKVSATILDVEWEAGYNRGASVGGKSNKSSSGGLVKVYEIKAKYSYEFGGKAYRSDKIALIRSRSSQHDKQKRTYDRLRSHQQKNKPYPAYVNPKSPDQAVLLRDFSWGMNIFMFIVGALGLVFSVGGFWSVFRRG